jgi:hypothetical protein
MRQNAVPALKQKEIRLVAWFTPHLCVSSQGTLSAKKFLKSSEEENLNSCL